MDEEPATPDTRKERALRRRQRLERRLAEAALGRFGLGSAAVEPLRLGEGFTQVCRVATRKGECFTLKLYSPPPSGDAGEELRQTTLLRSPEVLASQLGWLCELGRETDLLVPEPVPLPDGSLLGRVSTRDLVPRGSLLRWGSRQRDAEELEKDLGGAPEMSRNFALSRWLPGRVKAGEGLTAGDASLVGSYLARLHRHAEARGVPEGSAFPRWDWGWPFGESVPLWSEGGAFYSDGEMEVFEEALRLVREDLDRLGHGPEVFGLVHRDPKLENLVFDGGGVGAVDFDLSGLGHYLFDLRVFRASLRHRLTDHVGPLWAAFVEGYEGERPLPEDLERCLLTFDAMQKVAAVNRQLGRLGGSEEGGRRPARFLKKAATWLEEMLERRGTRP